MTKAQRTVKRRVARAVAGCCLAALTGAGALHGQSTLDRPPNMAGGWIGDGGVVRFHFLHRFHHSGAPTRQVSSQPTFLLAYSAAPVLAGVHYATRSEVAAGVPNEWEPFLRASLLPRRSSAAAAVTVAWNAAARAADAELTGSARYGRLTALLAGRVLGGTGGGSGGDGGDDGVRDGVVAVIAAGAVVRLRDHVALAADLAVPASGADTRTAWGAGLQLAIPYTPHSLSLQATNTNSATLRGASRATGRVRYGFEFTVPITLRRYFGARTARGDAATTPGLPGEAEPAARDGLARGGELRPHAADSAVVTIRIQNLAWSADSVVVPRGTTIEWRNDDPLPHTATADDASWDSGEIAPGGAWRVRLDRPGRFAYHCTPHPFMRAVIIVR
jgi:plastocyanin